MIVPLSANANARDLKLEVNDSCNCFCFRPKDPQVYINSNGSVTNFDSKKASKDSLKKSVSNLKAIIEQMAKDRSCEFVLKEIDFIVKLNEENPSPITLSMVEQIQDILSNMYRPKVWKHSTITISRAAQKK